MIVVQSRGNSEVREMGRDRRAHLRKAIGEGLGAVLFCDSVAREGKASFAWCAELPPLQLRE